MKRSSLLVLTAIIFVLSAHSQKISDVLENRLGGVVTVGVFKTDLAKNALGFRGESASEMAYKAALDMTGVTSSGSGFIIEKNGEPLVVTNAHVVENASDEKGSLYVYSISRKKYEVELIGGDSFYDLAVLRFVDPPGKEMATLKITSREPKVGEDVYAIGNPLGEYPYSVSDGIISAKNRVRGGLTGKFGFLQTTATLIWGNSGGPLLNNEGDVIGVNSQIAFADTPDGGQILQSQINFALEAELTNRIIEEVLKTNGHLIRAYLGIELSESSAIQRIGYDSYTYVEMDEYPKLTNVFRDSKAYSALGAKLNEYLVKINYQDIRNLEEALGELETIKPGETVELTFSDGIQSSTVAVKTSRLSEEQLSGQARAILSQNKDIQVDENHPQVVFTMANNDMHYYENRKYKQNRMSGHAAEKYYVLAAGIHSESSSNMWIADNYADLGAAFRLCGLAGAIDYFIMPSRGNENDIQVARQYLSGKEDVIKSTLWY